MALIVMDFEFVVPLVGTILSEHLFRRTVFYEALADNFRFAQRSPILYTSGNQSSTQCSVVLSFPLRCI